MANRSLRRSQGQQEIGGAGTPAWSVISLFGLSRRRLDVFFSLVLLAVLVGSRIAAFPASVWEQDEAYFVAAVHQFDIADSRPHPPWFPLWIGLGKAFVAAGLDAERALCLPAFLLSLWIFIPLRAFWRRFLAPPDATAAAFLFAVTPAAWWFSGRAFSGVGGTAMLVTGLACWFADPKPSRVLSAAGSVALGAATLIRPHLIIPVTAVAVVGLWRRSSGHRWVMLVPGVSVVAIGVAGLVFGSGGIGPLAAALGEHSAYHFGRLSAADWSLGSSGLSRCLGHPVAAILWVVLSVVGGVRLGRRRNDRTPLAAVCGVLTAMALLIFGLSNPTHARYYLPLLAMTAGLVVGGAGVLGRWGGWAVAFVAATAWSVWMVPDLARYRVVESPPVRAIQVALAEASRNGSVVVVDATLDAFVKREQAGGKPMAPIILWPLIEQGEVSAPPARFTIAVTDRASRYRPITAESVTTIASDLGPARVLGQDRFLAIEVSSGASLQESIDSPRRPLVLID